MRNVIGKGCMNIDTDRKPGQRPVMVCRIEFGFGNGCPDAPGTLIIEGIKLEKILNKGWNVFFFEKPFGFAIGIIV